MSRPGMDAGYDDAYSGSGPRMNGDEEYYIAYRLACDELESRYARDAEPEPTDEELCVAYGPHDIPAPLAECLEAIAHGIAVSCHCGKRWYSREELCALYDDADPLD